MSKRASMLIKRALQAKQPKEVPNEADSPDDESSRAPSLSSSAVRDITLNGYPWSQSSQAKVPTAREQGPDKCMRWLRSSLPESNPSEVDPFEFDEDQPSGSGELPRYSVARKKLAFDNMIPADIDRTESPPATPPGPADKHQDEEPLEVDANPEEADFEICASTSVSSVGGASNNSMRLFDDSGDDERVDSPEPLPQQQDAEGDDAHSADGDAALGESAEGEGSTDGNDVGAAAQRAPSLRRRGSPRDAVRKRALCPSKWRCNVAKAKLNAGEEHTTPKGVKRRARVLKPPCAEKCRKCKKRRLTADERQELFRYFWGLADVSRKWDFISRHVKCDAPKQSYTLPERAKSTTRKYFFSVNDTEVPVCKTMFLNTLDIVDKWVTTALTKCANGSVSPDKRGKHKSRPHRTRPATIASVKKHIESFPKVYAHYTRERSKRQYLETGLSIRKMYRLYKIWVKRVENTVEKPASERMYREIFNRQYNLGFFLPKKDQCELCNKFKYAKDNTQRQTLVKEYLQHRKNKTKVFNLRAGDKAAADETKCVAAFDLQKVLPCPRSDTSLFFYCNKLSLFNFTVFDLRLKEGHCYLWNETDGKKGADEIASCLIQFIELKASQGVKAISLYSDSPTGQNRNRMVFSMFMIASVKYKVYITHRFLESGHSYSEVDSVHARIEKEAKGKHIFDQNEWFSLIQNAKQEGEKYQLHNLTNEKVMDFHELVDRQNWEGNSEQEKVKWTKVREISFSPATPNEIKYRYNFDEPLKTLTITMKNNEQVVDLMTYQPPRAHNKRMPLKMKKQNDIRMLMGKHAIPTKYHDFYNEILSIE